MRLNKFIQQLLIAARDSGEKNPIIIFSESKKSPISKVKDIYPAESIVGSDYVICIQTEKI